MKLCPLGKSDHSVAVIHTTCPKFKKSKVTIRNFSPKNFGIFSERLHAILWLSVTSTWTDVDNALFEFEDLSLNSFPCKSIYMSSKDQPWVTPKIKLLMQEKDWLFHKKNN